MEVKALGLSHALCLWLVLANILKIHLIYSEMLLLQRIHSFTSVNFHGDIKIAIKLRQIWPLSSIGDIKIVMKLS